MTRVIFFCLACCSLLCAKEIQLLPSKVIGVQEDSIVLLDKILKDEVEKREFEINEYARAAMCMVLVKSSDFYILHFEMKVKEKSEKSKQEKFETLEEFEYVVSDLMNEVLNDREEFQKKKRETNSVNSVGDFIFTLLVEESNYIGLEIFLGAVNMFPLSKEEPYVSMDSEWGM